MPFVGICCVYVHLWLKSPILPQSCPMHDRANRQLKYTVVAYFPLCFKEHIYILQWLKENIDCVCACVLGKWSQMRLKRWLIIMGITSWGLTSVPDPVCSKCFAYNNSLLLTTTFIISILQIMKLTHRMIDQGQSQVGPHLLTVFNVCSLQNMRSDSPL